MLFFFFDHYLENEVHLDRGLNLTLFSYPHTSNFEEIVKFSYAAKTTSVGHINIPVSSFIYSGAIGEVGTLFPHCIFYNTSTFLAGDYFIPSRYLEHEGFFHYRTLWSFSYHIWHILIRFWHTTGYAEYRESEK